MPNRIPSLFVALLALICSAAAADSCGVPFTLTYKHGATDLTEEQSRFIQRTLAPYQSETMQIESLLVRSRAVSEEGRNQVPERVARHRAKAVHAHIVQVYPELRHRVFVEIASPGGDAAQDDRLLPHTVSVEFMCSRRDRFTDAKGRP
jgi:hypothetical protein